jgi:hypothetical protein
MDLTVTYSVTETFLIGLFQKMTESDRMPTLIILEKLDFYVVINPIGIIIIKNIKR